MPLALLPRQCALDWNQHLGKQLFYTLQDTSCVHPGALAPSLLAVHSLCGGPLFTPTTWSGPAQAVQQETTTMQVLPVPVEYATEIEEMEWCG